MRQIIASVTALQLLAACAAAADETATITPVEKWSCVFGDKEVTLHFRVANKKAGNAGVEGRLQWHYSANQRTLARGEVEIRRNDSGIAEVVLQIPKVRDGVIFQTDLAVSYVPRGANDEAATLTKPLWLFPEDPFADQRETLKERGLSLFDPEGRTAALFEKIELPHQRIRNVAALEDRGEHSYVIVGEGTSPIRNRGLAERLLSFAAAGGPVLMLAPSEGRTQRHSTGRVAISPASCHSRIRQTTGFEIPSRNKRLRWFKGHSSHATKPHRHGSIRRRRLAVADDRVSRN
jgi:hypothetical protein